MLSMPSLLILKFCTQMPSTAPAVRTGAWGAGWQSREVATWGSASHCEHFSCLPQPLPC